MAGIEYYVIDSITSIVDSVVVVEEGTDMGVLYPGKIIEPVTLADGIRRAHIGCLFHDSKYWSLYLDTTVIVTTLSQFAFRSLFTDAERIQIDNFATDDVISIDDKKILLSLIKSFDSAQTIDLTNSMIINGLAKLVDVGYLTDVRRTSILNNEIL